MAEKKTTKRWRDAVPISSAWRALGRPDLVSEYEKSHQFIDTSVTDRLPEDVGAGWKLGAAIIDGLMHLAKPQRLEAELKADLVVRLQAEEFDALGYRTTPTKSHEPVIIERAEFRVHAPNWTAETFAFREFAFRDVKIARRELPHETKRMGRPGSQQLIREAIRALIAEKNLDFCNLDRKVACENVRNWLAKKSFKIDRKSTGLSDVNIRKYILIYCPKRKLK